MSAGFVCTVPMASATAVMLEDFPGTRSFNRRAIAFLRRVRSCSSKVSCSVWNCCMLELSSSLASLSCLLETVDSEGGCEVPSVGSNSKSQLWKLKQEIAPTHFQAALQAPNGRHAERQLGAVLRGGT